MDRKADKRAKSEAQRLESLYEKRKLDIERKNQISQALKNVDVKSKRTVFEDSDNDENIVLNTMQSHSTRNTEEADPSKNKNQWTLFEDSDADNDGAHNADELIKNRHVGKKGAKLMAMEARFGNDDRFRMDDRFAEDSDEEPSEEQRENQDRLHTKKTELEILSKVVGKDLTSKLSEEKRKTEKKMLDMKFVRFDPDNPEHIEWAQRKQVEKYGEMKDEDEAPPKKIAKKEEAPERLVEGRYFEMDRDFAADLKNKLQLGSSVQSTSFSFLDSIGRSSNADLDKSFGDEVIANLDTEELPDCDELDIDDSMDDESQPTISNAALDDASSFSLVRQKGVKPWFSFDAFDNDVRSTVNNFRRTMPEDKLRANWQNIRTSIIKIYRSQKKSAVKEDRKRKRTLDGAAAPVDSAAS
ncbi:hypothetical protein QR680_002367 [Steinernema hermaphroditum]|uniref:Uncharacterized protein n=1 Tax=Steinernema hermaphroditum TaxID=289476 RepID=A0AA39H2E7_9BILA|nr:hypothetical protein QR680_002367 [Steinernema hermaphroditum]